MTALSERMRYDLAAARALRAWVHIIETAFDLPRAHEALLEIARAAIDDPRSEIHEEVAARIAQAEEAAKEAAEEQATGELDDRMAQELTGVWRAIDDARARPEHPATTRAVCEREDGLRAAWLATVITTIREIGEERADEDCTHEDLAAELREVVEAAINAGRVRG